MDIDFACTRCGNCCRNLRLPLSAGEARQWIADGHPVEVLCEAIVWPGDPPQPNPYAAYKRERSFAARSGLLPIRVLVTLAAPLAANCPNLGPDNICGIYARRPAACRIYPAESNPFLQLVPAHRLCPAEAWHPGGQPFVRDSTYAQRELRLVIDARLQRMIQDVPRLAGLCQALGIRVAAMANEGFVAHAPDQASLLQALDANFPDAPAPDQDWEFASDRPDTVEAIRSCDAHCVHASQLVAHGLQYLSLSA